MAAGVRITEAELFAAIAEASSGKDPADAKTTTEIAEETGQCRTYVVEALRALHKQGRLVAHHVKRAGYDGKMRPVSAFTILPATRKVVKSRRSTS